MNRYLLITFLLVASLGATAQKISKSTVESLLEEFQVPGVQISHIRNGQETKISAGFLKNGSPEPVRDESIFQAASLSKAVAAYAALRLYDRGVYHLDTPLLNYLPYERLTHDPRSKKITARMVLSHRTGLPNWANDTLLTIAFEPGTQHRYSGEGFQLLQTVLVHLEEKTFEQIMQEEVLKPIGMRASSFVYDETKSTLYATGHQGTSGMEPSKMRMFSEPNAAFTLLTTAHDYNIFVQKALLQGQGLLKSTHELMLSPAGSANEKNRPDESFRHLAFGLGVILQFNEQGLTLAHTGSNGGRYLAVFLASSKNGESIVIMTNGTNGKKLYTKLLDVFFPDQTQWFLSR